MSTLVAVRDAELSLNGRCLVRCPELVVGPGQRLAFMGPSGSGKTLTLRLLAGLVPAGFELTSGTRTAEAGLRIAFVPQRAHDALHPLYGVATQLRRVTRQPRSTVDRVLRALGLEPDVVGVRRPAELSGGQAQRAALALAALSGADLVLADEPTSALDTQSRNETTALLDDLAARLGAAQLDGWDPALVVATHDPEVPPLLRADVVDVEAGVVGSTAFAQAAP
jgi:ABC-type glutathione transport system ATPase component